MEAGFRLPEAEFKIPEAGFQIPKAGFKNFFPLLLRELTRRPAVDFSLWAKLSLAAALPDLTHDMIYIQISPRSHYSSSSLFRNTLLKAARSIKKANTSLN